jgi:hypothetical protein
MRIDAARLGFVLILMLPCSLVACGDETASSTMNASSSESVGTESGNESGSESSTETDTGEPSGFCETCNDDELCIAHADDACDANFGYTLECVPAVAACANGECDEDCLAAVCGNSICPPPCGPVPGVDVWCSGAMNMACDPIAQDCPDAEKCFLNADVFMCLPAPTLPPDAICFFGDYCAPGQACVAAIVLDSCAGEACCTDWCDTSEPDPCQAPETCLPYWPQGQAPAGLETVGVCKLG